MYDLIILGGGPAGVAAGVYAARKQLKTLFVVAEFGGQSVVSEGIQNWIGTPLISGTDLASNLKKHLHEYAGEFVDIKEGEKVKLVEKEGNEFKVTTESGASYQGKTILVATGSHRRKITVPGAKEFDNKGITYCASCDGPLFADKDVVVIGGGNAGFETAAQLLAYTKSVTLLSRNERFRADPVTVEKITKNPKMTALLNSDITEVLGDKFVTGIKYKDKKTGEEKEIQSDGVFVEIGAVPTTEFVKNIVETNDFGAVVVDPKNQKTNTIGIWAAGDCTDGLYHQNNIAAGDAVKALEDIYMHLHTK